MKDSEELTKEFVDFSKEFLEQELHKVKLVNLQMLKHSLSEELGKRIKEKTDRAPMIIPIFMDIAPKDPSLIIK